MRGPLVSSLCCFVRVTPRAAQCASANVSAAPVLVMRATISAVVVSALAALAACTSSAAVERATNAENEHPNGIYQRAQARSIGTGGVPHDALMQAHQHRLNMPLPDTFGSHVDWDWLGPTHVGGRLRAVVIDPANPQRIWVGSAGGGVWYSDTGGASWQPRNGLLGMLGCGCMLLDPANPNHLWFGSGEGFFDAVSGSSNTAILRGAGIFETFDAGLSWTRIASTATPDWYFTNRLTVAPGNPTVLLAATGSGIWRSTDAGQTWSQRTTERTLDVDFHPSDPSRAVAGRADGRAQWTTDGGLSWNSVQIASLATRVELAYARSNPTTVFATVSDTNWGIHVWRSLDGGSTWSQRSTSTITTYSLYNNCLWVDPTNDQNLVYGGVQCYRSTNAGASRSQISSGGHSDYQTFAEHPGYNGTSQKRLYAGDDGGLHTRADWQSGSWSALNTGLGVTQFYGAAMNPTSGFMVAGAQDNGTSRFSGNPAAWNYNVIGGDGGFCAADQNDPNYFYGGYQRLGLRRSSNSGLNWTDIRGATTSDPGFNFIPYFLLDPNDSNRMIACGRTLWRTNDCKTGSPPNWTVIKTPRVCTTAHFQDNAPCNHSTAQIALGNSDLIWVGHNDGEVYKTTNGTAVLPNWTLIDSAGGALPDRWVSSIAIDPTDHQRVVLSFMGYTADNLQETLDGGQTWQSVTGSGAGALPAVPVSWVVMHPTMTGLLFAATDLGLFHSDDGGANWVPIEGGPENVCIEQLSWKNDRELLVVTHGQGAWLAGLPMPATATIGTGCASGTPPVLTATPPALGTTTQFGLAAARPNAVVLFAVHFGAPVSVPFGGCIVHVDLPTAIGYLAGSTSAGGSWSHGVALPTLGSLVGAELTAQTMQLGSSGPMLGVGDLSTGLSLTLGL